MKRQEINELIFKKQIPIQLIWEDDRRHILVIEHNFEYTSGHNNFFPKWIKTNQKNTLIIVSGTNIIFQSNKENIEQCIAEFFFWFEINNGRCKEIIYYDTNN